MLYNHLLGLYEKALPSDMPWQERFELAKSVGVDFIELSVDETDEKLARLRWNRAERRQLWEMAWDAGMPFKSMCLSGHRRFPFGSIDERARQNAHDMMVRAIDLACDLGIRVIQLAGYDVYYEPSTEDSKRRFLEGMQWAASIAALHQVMWSVEIMDTDFLNSITRYQALKREIPSPWFTVYPDMGNLSAWGNDVFAELELGKADIVAMHVKETQAVSEDFGGKFKCVPFGTGCVDFAGVFRKLKEIGFTGPYMVEMWHQPLQDAQKEVTAAIRFVREQYKKGCCDNC